MSGWSTGYAGLGRSLINPTRINERMSIGVRGNVIDMITSRGWVSHDLFRRLGRSIGMTASEADEMERDLLAEYQIISRLLVENRLVPSFDAIHSGK